MLITRYNNSISYTKKFYFFNNNISSLSFIHTSVILNSDTSVRTTPLNRTSDINIDELVNEHIEVERALVKYAEKLKDKDGSSESTGLSEFKDLFPWLTDDNGAIMDYTKNVGLFDGVKYVSKFLETKYGIDKETVSQTKLSDFLEPFTESQKEVRIIDLYNHVSQIYNKDKEKFIGGLLNNEGSLIYDKISKPFGDFGDMTGFSKNDIGNKLKDLKWEVIVDSTEVALNVLPIAMNTISFGLVLRCYMKYVHNRPYLAAEGKLRQMEIATRNRHLLLFSLIGAPLVIFSLKRSGLVAKEMVSVKVNLTNPPMVTEIETKNISNIKDSSLLGIFTSLFNNMPKWVKLILSSIFVIALIVRIFGISNSVSFLNNLYYLKLYLYVLSILIILYLLFEVVILHLFVTKKINISDVLPEFIIRWLQGMEYISTNLEYVKDFKNSCYREIMIYIVIIIIVSIL